MLRYTGIFICWNMGRTITVTLGEYYDSLVRAYVKNGRYRSASEVLRAGLRKLQESENQMPEKVEIKTVAQIYQERFLKSEEDRKRELEELKYETIARMRAEGYSDKADKAELEWFEGKK